MRENNKPLPFPILVGDIGGTNARFAVLMDQDADPINLPSVKTASFETIDAAIQQTVLKKASIQPRTVILAIAGPVRGDEFSLTNCPWMIRPNQMIADLGFEEVIVLNDFEAQALAVAGLPDSALEKIGEGTVRPNASKVVLGPGTGLGIAGLLHAQNTWMPVPGEGGHIDIGPRTDRDYALFPHYKTIGGRVSSEELVCGRGLVSIYRAICAVAGEEPTLKTPADVTNAVLKTDTPDAKASETLTLFATYLGRIAGDMALTFIARGGVYLSGGVSQIILPILHQPAFRQSFADKAPHEEMMKNIPTYVVTHPLAAVVGLADYARDPSRFTVSTQDRHWARS